MLRKKFFPSSFFFSNFLPHCSVSSIHQFLGNFLHSTLDEDVPSSPICYTNILSRWPCAVTWIIRILNFFASNSGSPSYTQSGIIFSDLNFHQEQLVVLFVEDVLGDLIHQKRIFCESSEQYFLWLFRVRFSVSLKRMTPNTVPLTFLLTSILQHWSQNLLTLLFLSVQQRFPDCMLSLLSTWRAKSSWERCETEDSNTVGTPNCLVFSFVVFGKSEKWWIGSLMSIVSLSTEVIMSNSLGS